MPRTRCTVVGAGKYGSAIAFVLQQNTLNKVTLLSRSEEKVKEVNEQRTSKEIFAALEWN
jgi:glycerol-3-phosphate dehydrogenase